MKYLAHAEAGLLNLYYSKLRSFLALLGVLAGTASVVAMVLGGELATNEALKQFKSLGTDLLAVTINSTTEDNFENSGKADQLSLSAAQSLSASDKNILESAPYTQLFQPISYQGKSLSGMLLGVTGSFADIAQVKISRGRFISIMDKYEFYCVIGNEIYQAMKKNSFAEPLGQSLQIGKHIFIIVGVAKAWPENGFLYANIDTSILIPLLASTVVSKYAAINNIMMRLKETADIPVVLASIRKKMKTISPKKSVQFRSAKELIIKMKNQSDILTIFLGLIGSISLLVGGIGVMNIMLVSVMERKREIGIRLAVGAKPRDIGMLFLAEAVMLSLLGGFAGVCIGVLIAYLISVIWHWEFHLFLWPPLAGFSVSTGVGIFFGFYPAYLASKLDPIDALRSE